MGYLGIPGLVVGKIVKSWKWFGKCMLEMPRIGCISGRELIWKTLLIYPLYCLCSPMVGTVVLTLVGWLTCVRQVREMLGLGPLTDLSARICLCCFESLFGIL